MASVTSYAEALAAFNAVMAADPLQRALESGGAWGDIIYNEDLKKARQAVCPWAPKKPAAPARMLVAPTLPRCMVAGCSYSGLNLDEQDICGNCHATSNGRFQMRAPSEMTLAELEKAHTAIDEERKYARRSGDRWALDNLDVGAAAIQNAKDALSGRA